MLDASNQVGHILVDGALVLHGPGDPLGHFYFIRLTENHKEEETCDNPTELRGLRLFFPQGLGCVCVSVSFNVTTKGIPKILDMIQMLFLLPLTLSNICPKYHSFSAFRPGCAKAPVEGNPITSEAAT